MGVMTDLTSRIRLPDEGTSTTSEDIFNSGLEQLFPDSTLALHGDPGSRIVYASPRFGDIELTIADPEDSGEHFLFAHYLWNSSLLLAEYISQHEDELGKNGKTKWKVHRETVLELGAGTGLAGIISALAGADEVVISDYPSSSIIQAVKTNVAKNIPSDSGRSVKVKGHEWGQVSDSFSKAHVGHFTRVLCADCLWMDGEHQSLVNSMLHFLSPSEDARVWVIAGFHTGRAKVSAFFDVAACAGLVTEEIWECDVEGQERSWDPRRGSGKEDIGERKRWLVIAILKRKTP